MRVVTTGTGGGGVYGRSGGGILGVYGRSGGGILGVYGRSGGGILGVYGFSGDGILDGGETPSLGEGYPKMPMLADAISSSMRWYGAGDGSTRGPAGTGPLGMGDGGSMAAPEKADRDAASRMARSTGESRPMVAGDEGGYPRYSIAAASAAGGDTTGGAGGRVVRASKILPPPAAVGSNPLAGYAARVRAASAAPILPASASSPVTSVGNSTPPPDTRIAYVSLT